LSPVFRSRMLIRAVYATTTFTKVNTHSAGVVQWSVQGTSNAR